MDCSNCDAKKTSIIDASSIMIIFPSTKFSLLKINLPSNPYPKNLWIVSAYKFVVSFILLAALPVGATSLISNNLES